MQISLRVHLDEGRLHCTGRLSWKVDFLCLFHNFDWQDFLEGYLVVFERENKV